MKVKDILDSVHIAYEQAATDVPPLNDEDGKIRLNLVQKAVRRWATDNSTKWNELFEFAEVGPLQEGVREYSLPADYDMADGFYFEGSEKPIEVKAAYQITGGSGRALGVIGNKRDGYKVWLDWSPKAFDAGRRIIMKKYRAPFIPTALDDKLEMSNPEFVVAYVVAELFVNDDPGLYSKFNADALLALANMRQRNDMYMTGQYNGLEGDIALGV